MTMADTNRFRVELTVTSVPCASLASYLMRLALDQANLVFSDDDSSMVRFEAIAEGSDVASFTAGLLMVTVMSTTLPVIVYTAGEHADAGSPCEAAQGLMDHGCPEELANQLVVMACRTFQDEEAIEYADIN